jgi:hypothetical protein
MTDWQPIETAPRIDGEIVLGVLGLKAWPMEWSDYADGWIAANESPDLVLPQNATHWMPLPTPPA